MKFRKKPVVIEASQGWKNGDHPRDHIDGRPINHEGAVVRYYRRPDDSGSRSCAHCHQIMHIHGWIDTKEGGHIVCPGDWVITGVVGELYPCKPGIFADTYEPVVDEKE